MSEDESYLHLSVLVTDGNHTEMHFPAVVVRQPGLVVQDVQLRTALLAHTQSLLVRRIRTHLRLNGFVTEGEA